jgi:hypothetical protein
VQPTDEMGVVVQTIGRDLGFMIILAVIAGGRLLFGSLPDDAQFVIGVLDNLLQSLLKIHVGHSPFVWAFQTQSSL